MKPETDWPALARYLAGESPKEEADRVRRWLAEDPAREMVLARLDQMTRMVRADAPDVDGESALGKVKARFAEPEVRELPVRPRWWTPALRIAAALLLLAGGTLVWRMTRVPLEPGADPVTFSTGVGRTDSIPLPDGSHAILGPSSSLTILAGYGAPSRRLLLEGEAFFDATHDETRPFSVRAGAAEVHDLGTRFSVRSDAEGVWVVVESGSVRLQDTTRRAPRAVILRADQVGILRPDRQVPARRQDRAEPDLAWLRGQLIFDDASMLRVREDLRRWYGIELILADSTLPARHLTARFAGETPDQVLRVLELSLGATIERRGDSAIVRIPDRRRPAP